MQVRSSVIAGLAGASAVAILVIVLLTNTNGDGQTTLTTTPAASTTVAPPPSPTALPAGPEGEARSIDLIEVDGLLRFATQPETPEAGEGIYFLDIATGALEGWYPLVEGTFLRATSGSGRYTLFEREAPTFTGGVQYAAGQYLADRATRKVYHWEGDARVVMERQSNFDFEIAAEGDAVLFRIPVAEEDDWFSLLNVITGEIEAAFQAEAEWGLISQDGSKVALAAAMSTRTSSSSMLPVVTSSRSEKSTSSSSTSRERLS